MNVAKVVNNKIHILSGYKNAIDEYLDRVLIYDIFLNTWSVESVLSPRELTLFRRTLPFSIIKDDFIYVIDGLYYEEPEPIIDEDGKVIDKPDPIINFLPDVYKYQISTGIIDIADNNFIEIPRARYSGTTVSFEDVHYFIGGIGKLSNTLRFFESLNTFDLPFVYSDYTRLLRGRSSHGSVAYSNDYGEAIFVCGGVVSKQDEKFLRVEVDAVPKNVRLDGRQSCSVIIDVFDENEEAPSEVKVRLSANNSVEGDNVLFESDEILVKKGHAIATLLPRSDDAFDFVGMKDDTVRSYSVSVSGSIIDKTYYGDTVVDPESPIRDGTVVRVDSKKANVVLPPQYNAIRFETVLSPNDTTPGSYFASNLSNIGFISLRPSINSGGKDTNIQFFSDISWLPQIVSLIETNEGTYADALDKLERISNEIPFGGTPLMDSLVRSADTLNFDVSGVAKLIYVLTDGKENISHHTVDRTLSFVDQISGIGKTPVVSSIFRVVPSHLYLDQGIRESSTEIEYISRLTNGDSLYVTSELGLDESIKSLLKAKGFIGNGIFTFEIDLGEETLIETIEAAFDIPDAMTSAFWKYSVGGENRKFKPLTDRIEANETIQLQNEHGRFLRIVAEFSAMLEINEYIDDKIIPPKLTYVKITYHQKTESYIFINPELTKSEVYQVAVAMNATRPNGSEILFGAYDQITGTWEDYNSPVSPVVENNSRIVLPIRKSLDTTTYTLEKLISIDGFIFDSTYGKWSNEAKVVVYRNGTEIVKESEYKLIPNKGRIVFAYRTEELYVISIQNNSKLSVAAKIVNRVHGDPIKIAGSGFMYSTINSNPLNTLNRLMPEATNLLITPLQSDRDSVFRANYTYSDLKGRLEKISDKNGTIIEWYVNDKVEIDIKNLKEWDNKTYRIAKSGDVIYFTVEPATDIGSSLLIGKKVRSMPIVVG